MYIAGVEIMLCISYPHTHIDETIIKRQNRSEKKREELQWNVAIILLMESIFSSYELIFLSFFLSFFLRMHSDFFLSIAMVCMFFFTLFFLLFHSLLLIPNTNHMCVQFYIILCERRMKFDLNGHFEHMLNSIHK